MESCIEILNQKILFFVNKIYNNFALLISDWQIIIIKKANTCFKDVVLQVLLHQKFYEMNIMILK